MARVTVRNGRNQSRSGVEAARSIERGLPGIELSGGVLSTYPPEPGPLDVRGSYRGGPPRGPRHGSRGI